jgi:hypothetical protein
MINVNDFRISVFAQANKDAVGFKPSAVEFNAFMADALRETYNWLFGNASQYQPGRPVPVVSMEKTRYVAEAERYLQERRVILSVNNRVPVPDGTTLDQNGQPCPEFRHLIKMTNLYIAPGTSEAKPYEIRMVKVSEIDFVLNSEINAPTIKNPVAELAGNDWIIYPQSQHVELVYQRKWNTPVWGYTVDTTLEARFRREIYDPTTSTNIDLPDELFNVLKEKTLHMMGVRERDPFLIQSSNTREKQGNT